jgi:hypothetical protein
VTAKAARELQIVADSPLTKEAAAALLGQPEVLDLIAGAIQWQRDRKRERVQPATEPEAA